MTTGRTDWNECYSRIIGIEDLVGFDLVFGISALVGGFYFLWFVLLMVGGAASDLFDGSLIFKLEILIFF